MHLPPPPDSRALLPPLLACLPTALVSPRPPPALLPLLSPLLRQRVAYIGSGTSSGNHGWLPLLTWDAERAAKLPPIVERIDLEPHPVSGEFELEEVRPAKYRRLDEETLQAKLDVEQFELLPIFVWCETDEHGATGPGWKLAEVRSLEDADDGFEWFDSISQATDAAARSSLAVPQTTPGVNADGQTAGSPQDKDDDDDYWASYDRTPGRTPAQKSSPAPGRIVAPVAGRERSQSELEYFARYGAEVQPAMDGHDPDEENLQTGESTLNGEALSRLQESQRPISRPTGASMFPAEAPQDSAIDSSQEGLEAPRAISPTSSHGSIENLEARAAAMGEDRSPDRAQTAIKQHISTDIKSLFRLAKSSGMERREFKRIVKTELECLTMLEQDE